MHEALCLYETISTKTNYGDYVYSEKDEKVFVKNDSNDEYGTLMLASDKAKDTLLTLLDKTFGGDMNSVRAVYDFRSAMEKND